MSECSICRSLTKDYFDQKTSVFTSRKAVLYFLLHTLLTIKKYRDHLCYYSQREQKCTICDITNEFYSVEYDFYQNMFNFDFLNQIRRRLFMHLNKMFASKRCLCLILNNKFAYIWKDWYTGEKRSIYLEDAIAYKEKIDMDKIKLNGCSVCLK